MARRKYNVGIRECEYRKEEHRNCRSVFMIACEGISTEPKYLKNMLAVLKREKVVGVSSVLIIAEHNHSNPMGVLDDLLNDKRYDPSYDCWIVFDRDDEENLGKGVGGTSKYEFDRAIQVAESKGVQVAFSNPCFELWIVLHFKYRDTAVSRKEIQKNALDLLRSINALGPKDKIAKMKSLANLYERLLPYLDTAMKNAKRLYMKNGESRANPCTLIYKLLEDVCRPT